MRNCDSAYDARTGGAITSLLDALREAGHEAEGHVNGAVTVDGETIDSEDFDRAAMAWDGTEDGLEDLGF
jgi:hypothetical protein